MDSVQRAQSQTLTPRLHSTTFQMVKWAIILNLRGCAHIIGIPVCRTFTGHSENAGKHYRPCARRLQSTPEQCVWARCLLTYKSQQTRAHMQFYCVCCAAKNTQTCLPIYIVSTASALQRPADREDITHIRWATAWERWFLGVCAWCARIYWHLWRRVISSRRCCLNIALTQIWTLRRWCRTARELRHARIFHL